MSLLNWIILHPTLYSKVHLIVFPVSWNIYIKNFSFKNDFQALKLKSVAFFGVKNYPKYIFEKIHYQPVFKTFCFP